MTLAAADVACYQAALDGETCDFWQATLPERATPDNLWYRFIVTDGTDTDYYGDNTRGARRRPRRDDRRPRRPELGAHASTCPASPRRRGRSDAVIYQIFPDRFRNGRKDNDPKTGDVRYDDPVIALPWGTLPEGYCRNYADGNARLPVALRHDAARLTARPRSSPRGRDYMGGDLKGVDQQLDYLQSLGVNTIYFNPIFDAGRTTRYDTAGLHEGRPVLRRRRRTWTTSSSTPTSAGSGSSSTASSTTCRRTARSSTATTTTRRSAPASRRARRTARWFMFHDVTPARARARAPAATRPTTTAGSASTRSRCSTKIEPGRPGLLPDRHRQRSPKRWLDGRRRAAGASTCPATRRSRTATGRRSAQVVEGDQPGRADDQRDVAEGLDAAADAPRRPARHDDELPAPRRGHRRSSRPGTFDSKGFGDSGHAISAVGVRRPARLDPRGLPATRPTTR